MNWIGEYVDLEDYDTSAKLDLIHRFSLSTAEVENDIDIKGAGMDDIVVAEIISIESHLKSDHLHLLKVDYGGVSPVDVVCSASNVRVGMKTAFAKIGAHVDGIEIMPHSFAGYTSSGMCCSEMEIGISDDNSGIIDLDNSLVNGTDLKTIWPIDDIVFEVDNKSLTNRPDLWGHYGIAREFAVLTDRPLKPLQMADLAVYNHLPAIDMKIVDPLCYRYSCLSITNITKNLSPANIRIRLYYCGMRAINLLTDLTNYLMLEMGQPMHAFDSHKVEKIRVRCLDKNFAFQTLDGIERKISPGTLMICNNDEPVAIAGIMGGLNSEIVSNTTDLTLESATFDAASIRKSSVRLAHRTDASSRYEKSLDPEMTVPAIARFVHLLQSIDNGIQITSRLTDEYAFHYPHVTLDFDRRYVECYAGVPINNKEIERPLIALGFTVRRKDDKYSIDVPSWRATKDITIKADIVEEIIRIYGYDNLEANTKVVPLYPVRMSTEKTFEDALKDLLVLRYGLHEVHSYIWQYASELHELGIGVDPNVKIIGAANPSTETLRRSMVPTQLCQLKRNVGFSDDFGIFEIGRVVDGLDDNGLCLERKMLSMAMYSRTRDTQTLYMILRDYLAEALDLLKLLSVDFKSMQATKSWQHPKNLNAIYCNGHQIGYIGILHPRINNAIDKKSVIIYSELDVNVMAQLKGGSFIYQTPSKYPSIIKDLTVISDRYAPIDEAIRTLNSPLLQKVSVISTFEDASGRSISIRLFFSNHQETLKNEAVQQVIDRLITELCKIGLKLKI